MNVKNKAYPVPASLTLATLVLSLAGMPGITQASPFTPPDLEGFNLHDERDADGDGDGKNETHIKHYLNASGDSLASFTSKGGQVWAWSLDTRDDESGPKNYVIRDSNCDGIFNEVYGLDDEFHVPECVK